MDLALDYRGDGWSAYTSYSHLDATYQFIGTLASKNNPSANADGNVLVTLGNHIPLNPANTLKAGGDVTVMEGLSLGGELAYTGSRYFQGDPSNLNSKLSSYVVVNLRAAYDITPKWQVFGLVDNILNSHSATYGTYFQPDDTAGLLNPALTDPRTLTLQQPITFQLGLKLTL